MPLVLTHLELLPSNIILGDDSRVYVTDWRDTGFYPQWFQRAAMLDRWEILDGHWWKPMAMSCMAGFYAVQGRFFRNMPWYMGVQRELQEHIANRRV